MQTVEQLRIRTRRRTVHAVIRTHHGISLSLGDARTESRQVGFVEIALAGVDIECVVAAPGKIERPARDRIKTDVRDSERLVRC